MRGKLIFPFDIRLATLDVARTKGDPDGVGPLTTGYDDVFREPVKVATGGAQVGSSARKERIVSLRAQIEPAQFEVLRMMQSGNAPRSEVTLVLHFKDLELADMVNTATGEALVRVNDRLHAIYSLDGELIQQIRNPPGLFVHEVQPRGFGFGRKRNLLLVVLRERELSVP